MLDVLRSIAILLVFTGHFAGVFQASERVSSLPMIAWSWSGVDLFFVLSGLLTGRQLWTELKSTGTIDIPKFILRRGLRIWPLYFVFLSYVFLKTVATDGEALKLWSDAVLLSNYFKMNVAGGWSLFTEEQFYLVAPLCLLFARSVSIRRLWVVPTAGLIALIAFRAAATYRLSGVMDPYQLKQYLYYPIHTHSDGLAIGMLIAWVQMCHPRVLASRWKRTSLCLVMILTAAGLYRVNGAVFNFTALALSFGALTITAQYFTKVPALFRWKGFYVMSRLSFGIYLNHFGVLWTLSPILLNWRRQHGEITFWGCYIVCLAASIILAGVLFYLVEVPFLRLRSHLLTKRPKPQLESIMAQAA